MKGINSYKIASRLEDIIFNMETNESIKIKLFKNFSLSLFKVKTARGYLFEVFGEIFNPYNEEQREKVLEFSTQDITVNSLFSQITFINSCQSYNFFLFYDVDYIEIEAFTYKYKSREDMEELLTDFNYLVSD